MRHTGTLTDWKADKGFGFITPVAVGTKLFVHVSEFERGGQRPAVGDRLTYEVGTDSGKGPRARLVRFVDAGRAVRPRARLRIATMAALAFLAWLAFGVATRRIDTLVLLGVGVMTTVSFVSYAFDKAAARNDRQRIPEGTLHFLDTIGGWPGGAFAQQWLRHKSSKRSFLAIYWVTVAINVIGAVLAFTAPGRAAFAWVVERF
jgi:uncharacterized membrane protein YsdA (DUF1294 family)/cold shock CspA family protein